DSGLSPKNPFGSGDDSIVRLISGGRSVRFVRTKRWMGSLTAQGSSLENCRPKGLGGSNPSPSAIWKRVREAYCAWLLTRCWKPPRVRILPLPFLWGCAGVGEAIRAVNAVPSG